jgi:glyceraldehyde 3-phosphate dehydrogenase
VNEPKAEDMLISAASCTTNCVAPLMEILGRRVGVKKALMTTVHAYTSSQSVVDMPDKDRRRGRAAAINFVPASTGAARATALALPEYKGIFDGVAIRGPVPSGSIADITLVTKRNTSKEELNKIFLEESESERYKGVLGIAHSDMVSSDVIRDARASVVDTEMTMVVDGDLVKIMSWYDNEWGYVNQMLRTGLALAKRIRKQAV